MSEPSQRLVTAAEFYALPEDESRKLELIGGILYETSAAAVRHLRVQATLVRGLGGPFDQDDDGPGGWWILSEPGVELSDYDVPEPDLAGWRRERLPMLPDDGVIRIAPDWVCEVLSPSTARRDRTLKTELYAAHGVGHLWIIDPVLRTIEAYRNHEGHWLLLGAWTDGHRAAIAPFEAVTLDVARLFLPKPPDMAADGEPAPYGP